MIITIDGPAGVGKTTVAKKVAEKLGFQFFDTGAMYRAVTYQVIKNNLDLNQNLEDFLKGFSFRIVDKANEKQYFVNDLDVTNEIREERVTHFVSEVSSHPLVRNFLLKIQRDFGQKEDSVFEGRDLGTVIFPQAELKIFLTARPSVRAERRYLELKEKQIASSQQTVLDELSRRDESDSTREIAPLKQAEDAHLIDTSDLTIDQVVDRIIALTAKKK